MKKGFLISIFSACLLGLVLHACGPKGPDIIKIGINAPLSGDIPKVGEGTKLTAQMWLEDINADGGIRIGDKKYKVELVIEDNRSRVDSAVKASTKMIKEYEVLAIVGPQASKQAIPAGEVANNLETPMISPWSTNSRTTQNRPFVFRGCFLDPFQGPAVAQFAKSEFGYSKAAVLFDATSDYSSELAEFFKRTWEEMNGSGSVVAYESFTSTDKDYSSQLATIKKSGAEFLFTPPQNYYQIAQIVQQAHQMGWSKPIIGSDTWGSTETVKLCGKDCYGLFFTTHYAAAGAKGATRKFIDRYKAKYGYEPDDVAALTWDSMRILQTAIEGIGALSGDIKKDREAVRNALTAIRDFQGITGNMTFSENGDPAKCAVVVKISDTGQFEFYKSVCP